MDLCLSSDEDEGASPSSGKDFVFTSDEEEEARPPRKKEAVAVPKTDHKGVYWDKQRGKWFGLYYDKLQGTQHNTPLFPKDQLAACIAAYEALKAPGEARFWAQVTEWKEADPKFEGVPLGPENAADAKKKTVYWRLDRYNDHKPYLAVRISNGKRGFQWMSACQKRGCTNKAVKSKEGKAVHCLGHGGGCPHGKQWVACRECNGLEARKIMSNCSNCSAPLEFKRRKSNDGCGLCAMCENQKLADEAAEAAARGEAPAAPAPKKARSTKQQELKMLERLILADYTESFDTGIAPRPGEFIREAHVDHRCALAPEFEADEKKFAKVDFVVCPKRGGMLVFLEVDEHEHKFAGYSILCDTTRMWNVCQSIMLDGSGEKNVLWLRLNPDTRFAIGNDTHSPSNTIRCDAVCALLDTLEGKPNDPPMRIAYACYQMESDCTATITRDSDYHADVRPAARRLEHRFAADGALTLALA